MGGQREERTGWASQRGPGRLSGATGIHGQWGVGHGSPRDFNQGTDVLGPRLVWTNGTRKAGTDLEPYIHTVHTYIHAFSIP